MMIALARAMIAQNPKLFSEATIIGNADASLTICSQVFAIVEAKTSYVSQAANAFAAIRSAVCLGSILNDSQSVFPGKIENRLHIDRVTIKVNRQNGTCPRGIHSFECTI